MAFDVVSALTEKRVELASQIEVTERKLREMQEELRHLDATIILFDPAISFEQTPARRQALSPVKDLYRYVLDTLRTAGNPMSSREIALAIMARLGRPASELDTLDTAIYVYAKKQKGRLLERVGVSRPARWRVRVEVE